jgi:hypothetical protein
MLRGKGLWAYREEELDRAFQIAPQMGATHILYKVGQGSNYRDGMGQVARRIASVDLVPFGWTWLLLDDPCAEAQVVVRALQDGFKGLVFDTESSRCRNRFEQAARLGQHLRAAGIHLDKLYNCSFPNISHHTDIPYAQMNEFCQGGLMPMSYGTFFAPDSAVPHDQQAQHVIDEWTYGHYEYWRRRWGNAPPLYPVLGPYHDEEGDVRMGPAEFQIWLDRMAAHGPSFFSVFTAAVINDDLLPLIRACPLGKDQPPTPTGMSVEVASQGNWLNVRSGPSTAQPSVGRVEDGARLDALEAAADVRAKVGQEREWLHVRTPDGIEGYVAAWYVRLLEETESTDIVYVQVAIPGDVGHLNVRPDPSAARSPITQVEDGEVLQSLESARETQVKVGQAGEWLHVRTPDDIEGYVAAWYLEPVVAPQARSG